MKLEKLEKEFSIKNNIDIYHAKKTKKYIWICSKNKNHIWLATISKRMNGTNCPHCAGKRIETNNLLLTNPILCEEWDYEKNDITPDKVFSNSNILIWWKCSENHSWKASINNRNRGKTNCPYCIGIKPTEKNNLLYLSPEKCKEWDYNKNKITPENYLPMTNKKVWWKCINNHSWKKSINSKTCCPICFKSRQTSLSENSIHFYLSKYFKIKELKIKQQKITKKVDVYIPTLNLIIEYDGFYYHKNKYEVDEKWTNIILEKKYKLLRIREQLKPIKFVDNYIKKGINDVSMTEVIKYIFKYINVNFNLSLNSNIIDFKKDKNLIYNKFQKIKSKTSVALLYPELLKEWSKNNIIQPENIHAGSTIIVEWCCEKNHTWKTSIRNRTGYGTKKATNCPYCCHQKIDEKESIYFTHPKIINITNNKKILKSIHSKSSKKIDIICNECGYIDKKEIRNIIKNNICRNCKCKLI